MTFSGSVSPEFFQLSPNFDSKSGKKIIKSYPKSIKIERYDSTDSTGTTKSKNDKNNPYEKPPYSYMAMIQVNI